MLINKKTEEGVDCMNNAATFEPKKLDCMNSIRNIAKKAIKEKGLSESEINYCYIGGYYEHRNTGLY